MHTPTLPATWLLVMLAGLGLLSENIYSPALPAIAHALHASEAIVEYTLSIYLAGFAIGTLFWGKLSDQTGRKPCVIAGLLIFIVGCIGCYFSPTIEMLMLSRLVQAFGGSIGSVLGQAICRDAFHGPALGRVYAAVGSTLAIFPAIGPIIGGVLSQYFGWNSIFLILSLFAIILLLIIQRCLPETHPFAQRQKLSLKTVSLRLLKDKKVLSCALLIGACNGIGFSYFAEGSFCLISILDLAPSLYGLSFILIALSTMLGGLWTKRMYGKRPIDEILTLALNIILSATASSAFLNLIAWFIPFPKLLLIAITIGAQMAIMFGSCMLMSNILAQSLTAYKDCIGTASSLFGFFYYVLISLATFAMGALHNGSLLPMPLYFLGLSIFMRIIQKKMLVITPT